MKYLLITLLVQDGENHHDHRILHITPGKNIQYASQKYASNYYGDNGEYCRDTKFWEFNAGCIAVKVYSVVELSEYEYKLMKDIFDGDRKRPEYFQIQAAGMNHDLEREEIQIHCGENGNLMIVKTPEGFVIDMYAQNDHVSTLPVWEDDLSPLELTIDPKYMNDRICEFLKTQGQSHSAITAELGLSRSHTDSDEILMEDYFYLEKKKQWYPKNSSMYTDTQQAIADYLQENRDNY